MDSLRLLFEAIPVILAVVAIFVCSRKVLTSRRVYDRRIYGAMTVCAALLVIAQSSWTYTLLKGMTKGTDTAEIVWTVFNTCVMTVFIFSASRGKA